MMSLTRDAVSIANERLWAAHPELGRRQLTLASEDRDYRAEWWLYYEEALNKKPPLPDTVPSPAPAPSAEPVSSVSMCPTSQTPPKGKRKITSITMKRKHIHLTEEDKYGHWWFEIDGTESYGWWPKKSVGLIDTLGGTEGELNGQTTFNGTPTQDPHHGDSAEEEFNPMVAGDDERTEEEIQDCLRDFANSYAGEWRWIFGNGQNCHTFQEEAMRHCKLDEE